MSILGLDHINLTGPHDLISRCRAFYVDVLGLSEGPRPPFTSDGFWLYAGDRPVVHLSEKDVAAATGSALDHYAFRCDGFDDVIERLKTHSISFRSITVPATGDRQLFLQDPCGVGVELNFGPGSRYHA